MSLEHTTSLFMHFHLYISPICLRCRAQVMKPDTNRLRQDRFSNVTFLPVKALQDVFLCDVPQGRPMHMLPEAYRYPLFLSLHNLAHPDMAAWVKLMIECFAWFTVKRDVHQWSRSCLQSQRVKVYQTRSHHAHVDLAGPLQPSHGYVCRTFHLLATGHTNTLHDIRRGSGGLLWQYGKHI